MSNKESDMAMILILVILIAMAHIMETLAILILPVCPPAAEKHLSNFANVHIDNGGYDKFERRINEK